MMLDFLSVSFWIWMLTRIGASERCDDWGVDYTKQVWAYDGEPTRIKCPLYLEYLKHNYSTVHSTGLTLMWYCMRQNQELEEPINFRVPGNRISKEKDTVWFRPAVFNDTGNYTCMLRNTTHCSKVAFPLNVIKKDPDSCHSLSQKFYRKRLYYEEEGKLECPDTDGFYPPTEEANITWYHNCIRVDRFVDRYIKDKELVFTTALAAYLGNYTCVLSYFDHGKRFSLTRTITVEMKASPNQARAPTILIPSANQSLTFAVGDDAVLICSAFFSFLETSPSDVWWTINEQKVENISNPRISTDTSVEELSSGDKVIKVTLTIQDITQEELKSKFFCHAENTKGSRKSEAIVQQKFPGCTIELACGLGVTLLVFVLVIIIYRFFWLELVLLYRAHFGTDETIGDGKEYDVYVSYARNAEEEEFVLLVLCGVLENEFGYKLCIFDRDSLPGGNVAEAVFRFIQKSRRMIIVLSPEYLTEKSISMAEFKLGISCQNALCTKLILVEYKPLKHYYPEIVHLKESTSFIKWKGEKSKKSGSRFWKALHLALPLRSLTSPRALIESYSSHSDISVANFHNSRAGSKCKPAPCHSKPFANGRDLIIPKPVFNPKGRPNPSRACQCCVTYSNGDKVVRRQSRGVALPSWETHLCKPKVCGKRTEQISTENRVGPPPSDSSATSYRYYTDLSNNNDFCVL